MKNLKSFDDYLNEDLNESTKEDLIEAIENIKHWIDDDIANNPKRKKFFMGLLENVNYAMKLAKKL